MVDSVLPALDSPRCGEHAHTLIGDRLARLVALQAEVLADRDPEPLHQMRVSFRRLRSTLEQFSPALLLPDAADPERIARYGPRQVARLLADPGIVRNRQKVAASITNARAYLAVQEEHGRFATFLWSFVEGRTQVNAWRTHREMPVTTPISDALSKALKRRGFSFVGSTMMYAYMQSVGMVNDHLVSCFRYRETVAQAASGKGPKRPAGRRTTR